MTWKILTAAAIALLLYNAVYFEQLSVRSNREQVQLFDAGTYARDFWDNRLPAVLASAIDVNTLLPLLQSDMNLAVEQYGKRLGIGNTYYYLIKGEGLLLTAQEDRLMLQTSKSGEQADIVIQTDFIFGNAIRDASGLVNVSQFVSTMEFNSVSSEINKIVSVEVISAFLEAVHESARVRFIGACEVDKEAPQLRPLVIIPIRLEAMNE
jgi:predicted lipoprotein